MKKSSTKFRTLRFLSCSILFLFALILTSCGNNNSTNNAQSTSTGGTVQDSSQTTKTTKGPDTTMQKKPLIVATTPILADITKNITGESAEVISFIPQGVDPHEFEPSTAQIKELYKADLIISVGLGFEAKFEEILLSQNKIIPVFEVASQVGPNTYGSAYASQQTTTTSSPESPDASIEEDYGEEYDETPLDPHVWLDPDRVSRAVQLISDEIANTTTIDESILAENTKIYQKAIADTDEEIQELLKDIPDEDRRLFTNHQSLGYFAERYSFEIIDSIYKSGSHDEEPSTRELSELQARINEDDIPAIFIEESDPYSLANILAEEANHPVSVIKLTTESLGKAGSGSDTYLTLMVTCAQRIAGALQTT